MSGASTNDPAASGSASREQKRQRLVDGQLKAGVSVCNQGREYRIDGGHEQAREEDGLLEEAVRGPVDADVLDRLQQREQHRVDPQLCDHEDQKDADGERRHQQRSHSGPLEARPQPNEPRGEREGEDRGRERCEDSGTDHRHEPEVGACRDDDEYERGGGGREVDERRELEPQAALEDDERQTREHQREQPDRGQPQAALHASGVGEQGADRNQQDSRRQRDGDPQAEQVADQRLLVTLLSRELANTDRGQAEVRGRHEQREEGHHQRVLAEARNSEVPRDERKGDERERDRTESRDQLNGRVEDDALRDVHAAPTALGNVWAADDHGDLAQRSVGPRDCASVPKKPDHRYDVSTGITFAG